MPSGKRPVSASFLTNFFDYFCRANSDAMNKAFEEALRIAAQENEVRSAGLFAYRQF